MNKATHRRCRLRGFGGSELEIGHVIACAVKVHCVARRGFEDGVASESRHVILNQRLSAPSTP
jgi:hypothetical protein